MYQIPVLAPKAPLLAGKRVEYSNSLLAMPWLRWNGNVLLGTILEDRGVIRAHWKRDESMSIAELVMRILG